MQTAFAATATAFTSAVVNPAIVARNDLAQHAEQYLLVTPAGASTWVNDPEAATPFSSMREATRMAMRLPASQRAYGLPREGVAAH